MGVLQRIVNMTRAAANEMLDKMENPVMMMNHYLRDLEDEIAAAERSQVQQLAQERVLKAKASELEAQAKQYEGKAEQAAVAGREAEARAALEAKLLYLEQAGETARLQQLAQQAALDLKLRVEALKEEKEQLQAKRTELAARAQRAGATAAVSGGNYAGGAYGLQGSEAARGFERMEQKVMEWEARSELARSNSPAYGTGGIADQQASERNALIEEQLQQLLDKNKQ